ncbi:MAG: hypothetical protein EHM45_12115 [Desulfobacteraceae bacterium]|nr:MAG: hypothetical protein EHM45_12115 [Desulfobacteraceae bacterium]
MGNSIEQVSKKTTMPANQGNADTVSQVNRKYMFKFMDPTQNQFPNDPGTAMKFGWQMVRVLGTQNILREPWKVGPHGAPIGRNALWYLGQYNPFAEWASPFVSNTVQLGAEALSIQAALGVTKTGIKAANTISDRRVSLLKRNTLAGMSFINLGVNIYSTGVNFNQTKEQWKENDWKQNTRNVIGVYDGLAWGYNDCVTLLSRFKRYPNLIRTIGWAGRSSGYLRMVGSGLKWGPGWALTAYDTYVATKEAAEASCEIGGGIIQESIGARYGLPTPLLDLLRSIGW